MFEFDVRKSQANFEKHGIDFVVAQDLWDDPRILEVKAKTKDEARYLMIGKIKGKTWSAIVTYRDTKIRIISVRRARKEEVALYES